MPGPLAGIRVFDLTMWMVGPWCSMQLGGMGADIIHIEQPGVLWSSLGAGVPPTINGTSIGYIAWNMNKRGLFLDLKATEDRSTAYELIKSSDVFIVNMRTGVADRLGLSYEALSAINPNIVYCSITGWGETGPMATRPGADTQVGYFTGLWSTQGATGEAGQVYRHFTQTDATSGNYAAQAILMALLARKRTGRGQKIELSMLRCASAIQTPRIAEYLARGSVAEPLGSASQATAPDQAFLCEDKQYVGVSVTSEAEWKTFCAVTEQLQLPDDPRFASNVARVEHRAELTAALEPVFRSKPQFYWVMKLNAGRIPCGYPMQFEQLRQHPQVVENDYIVDVETSAWGNVYTGGPPWHFSETPARWFGTPMPGEHTGEILDELKQPAAPLAGRQV